MLRRLPTAVSPSPVRTIGSILIFRKMALGGRFLLARFSTRALNGFAGNSSEALWRFRMWGSLFPRAFSSSPRHPATRRKSRSHAKGQHAKGLGRRLLEVERLEHRWLLASDPIVTVDTNFGNFQIELRPDAAPKTVANFLSYVESGAYTDSIFHRSVPGFVEQAGGFTSSTTTFTSTSQFTTIPTNAPVALEYKLPNVA